MGKLGRFACIFTPMALSIASLLCLLLVWLAGQTRGLNGYYFLRADATNFTANPNTDVVPGTALDDNILNILRAGNGDQRLENIYQVYIWNYCRGPNPGDLNYCSPRQASFWFNPVEVWGLQDSGIEERFPQQLQQGLDVYRRVAGWMFAAYAIAFWVTVAEIVVGIFAVCSRWGSFVTTLVSAASTLFTIAAAGTSTALYGSLAGAFNTVLRPYNIEASVGTPMLSLVWIAAAFSTGAGLFWLISTCCCSGKNDKRKKTSVEKTPYTYERVSSPFGNRHNDDVPLRPMDSNARGAYEPYRQV